MKKHLEDFFNSKLEMRDEILKEISGHFEERRIAKNDLFLEMGKTSNEYGFLIEGYMRAYTFNTEGEEITTNIYCPKEMVLEPMSFFKRVPAKENIQAIPNDVPVYAFAGDKDPVGFNGKGFLTLIKNWKASGMQDISYHLYKGGRHEMLHEINSEEVVSHIISWLNRHS